jgi:hypothetical protein
MSRKKLGNSDFTMQDVGFYGSGQNVHGSIDAYF